MPASEPDCMIFEIEDVRYLMGDSMIWATRHAASNFEIDWALDGWSPSSIPFLHRYVWHDDNYKKNYFNTFFFFIICEAREKEQCKVTVESLI